MQIVIDIPEETYQQIKETSMVISGRRNGKTIDYILFNAVTNGTSLPKCNECKYYEGVHKVQGHAPCSYHIIGGVMWDWYCSQFEADKESEE